MPTFYLDPIGGNDANDGLSFANRWKTIGGGPTPARVAPGDEIRFIESPAPTLIGNCTWTNGARSLTVPAGTVKLIDELISNTGWVAAANVTLNAPSTTRLIGGLSVNFSVAAAFTTGKLAHKPLTIDLTGFHQVNVWFRSNNAFPANSIVLDLCSDASGDVPVVSVPFVDSNQTAAWFAGLVAHTGSIGTINSIALRAIADPGTHTALQINNLWASKAQGDADEITLATLVSKAAYTTSPPLRGIGPGFSGDTPLLGVVGVLSDTSVVLNRNAQQENAMQNAGRTIDEATATVATYAHQCFRYIEERAWAPQEAATDAAQTVWTGGWSATDMATRTSMTRYMLSSRAYLAASSGLFHTFENFMMNGSAPGSALPGAIGCRVSNCFLLGCAFQSSIGFNGGMLVQDTCYTGGNIRLGGGSGSSGNEFRNLYVWGGGLQVDGGRQYVIGVTSRNCQSGGILMLGNPGNEAVSIDDLVTLNNSVGGMVVGAGVNARMRRMVINEVSQFVPFGSGNDGMVSVESLNNIAGNDVLFTVFGRVTRQTAVVDTEASSRRVQVTNSNAISRNPMRVPLGQFEITRGVTTSIAIRMRRDNTGLSLGLSLMPTEGLPGITTEQRALMTAAANTWETVTLTLSPTGSGTQIVSLDVIAWGGTTFNGYFEAITVT